MYQHHSPTTLLAQLLRALILTSISFPGDVGPEISIGKIKEFCFIYTSKEGDYVEPKQLAKYHT